MTEITDEGRKLAAEWRAAVRTQLSALEQEATDHLALKAEHEKAVADLREIDRILAGYVWIEAGVAGVADIAAKYRETDPLVEAIEAAMKASGVQDPVRSETNAMVGQLRAELSKRGFELARMKP